MLLKIKILIKHNIIFIKSNYKNKQFLDFLLFKLFFYD